MKKPVTARFAKGIDYDDLLRSLDRVSSHATAIPSYGLLETVACASKKARVVLERLYRKSVEFVSYVQRTRRKRIRNYLIFGRRCRKFGNVISRLVDDFRRALNRPDIIPKADPGEIARKLVFTAEEAVA